VALARELREEVQITAGEPVPLGVFSAPAANEPEATVIAHAFAVRTREPARIDAEIEEAAWLDPAAPGEIDLAPLTRDHMLPLAQTLIARGALR
jgi:8-oxo-dGTP pyrophosphatase MutT (NUDIX family)